MHIILVSDRLTTAKSINLSWRHLIIGVTGFVVLVIGMSSLFSYVTVRHAAEGVARGHGLALAIGRGRDHPAAEDHDARGPAQLPVPGGMDIFERGHEAPRDRLEGGEEEQEEGGPAQRVGGDAVAAAEEPRAEDEQGGEQKQHAARREQAERELGGATSSR